MVFYAEAVVFDVQRVVADVEKIVLWTEIFAPAVREPEFSPLFTRMRSWCVRAC